MSVKRITVRVSPELHERATEAADQQQKSLNQFVTEAIETYVRRQAAETDRWPLRELGALLAPAAEANELSEDELLRRVREVRQRIWKERYEETTRALEPEKT